MADRISPWYFALSVGMVVWVGGVCQLGAQARSEPSAPNKMVIAIALPKVVKGSPNAKAFAERLAEAFKAAGVETRFIKEDDASKARKLAADLGVHFILLINLEAEDEKSVTQQVGGVLAGMPMPGVSLPGGVSIPAGMPIPGGSSSSARAEPLLRAEYFLEELDSDTTLGFGGAEQRGSDKGASMKTLATRFVGEVLPQVRTPTR